MNQELDDELRAILTRNLECCGPIQAHADTDGKEPE
jgi:hypothetical protein